MSAPLRIASLLASATEILYGLGLGDAIVGVSHECDYPAPALNKPRLTRSHVDASRTSLEIDQQVQASVAASQSLYEIDQQLLVDLAPDLIVTQAQCDVCAIKVEEVQQLVRRHAALQETQIVTLSPNSLEDVLADILRIGRATQRVAAAESFVAALQQRVERVREVTSGLDDSQRPRVVCIEWVEPLMVAANWTPDLVAGAGGINGISRAGQHSQYVSWDQIVAFDPQVLVLIPCGFDLQRTLQEVVPLVGHDGWDRLSAVQSGRVFAIDGNAYFNRSGPRLVDSLEILAHLFHPNRLEVPPSIPPAARVWSTFPPRT